MTSLRDLGFPNFEQLKEIGVTPAQFYDLTIWMHNGRRRPWWRSLFHRQWPLTGREVVAFIREEERKPA